MRVRVLNDGVELMSGRYDTISDSDPLELRLQLLIVQHLQAQICDIEGRIALAD